MPSGGGEGGEGEGGGGTCVNTPRLPPLASHFQLGLSKSPPPPVPPAAKNCPIGRYMPGSGEQSRRMCHVSLCLLWQHHWLHALQCSAVQRSTCHVELARIKIKLERRHHDASLVPWGDVHGLLLLHAGQPECASCPSGRFHPHSYQWVDWVPRVCGVGGPSVWRLGWLDPLHASIVWCGDIPAPQDKPHAPMQLLGPWPW